MSKIGWLRTGLFAALLSAALPLNASADPVADFYQHNTIRIIVATAVGDGYDLIGRLIARHLGEHIPGKPTIIVENMPGADGFKAANYLANVAAADGTVLATFSSAIAFYQATGHPGRQFKAENLSWIGSIPQDPAVVAVWYTSGVKTIADATRIPIAIGATGANGMMAGYPALLNSVFGTKFKIVTGYEGANAINLAMERGEVQGRGNNTWTAYKTTNPEWVKDGKILAIVQIGPHKDADLPDVPLLTDLSKDADQRRMFEFVSSIVALGQPLAAPPAIPSDRLQVLREAFLDMGRDAAFIADASKMAAFARPPDLASGEAVAKIVRDTVGTPPALIAKAQDAMTVDAAKARPEK